MRKAVALLISFLIAFTALSTIGYCADAVSVPLTTDSASAVTKLVGSDYTVSNDLPWTAYFKVANSTFYMSSDINTISTAERQEVLTEFVAALNQDTLKVTQKEKQAMYNSVRNNIDDIASVMLPEVLEAVKPDIWAAAATLYPFTSTFSTILGIAVIGIVILLIGSIVCDLVYLGSPYTLENLTSTMTDFEHPPLVSREALKTVKEYNESKSSTSIYALYLRKRVVTYIVLAVAILYLISGQIGSLIGWLFSLTSGIVS